MEKVSSDIEMLKYLDALMDIDPGEDNEIVELLEDAGDLGMFEADADGDLEEDGK